MGRKRKLRQRSRESSDSERSESDSPVRRSCKSRSNRDTSSRSATLRRRRCPSRRSRTRDNERSRQRVEKRSSHGVSGSRSATPGSVASRSSNSDRIRRSAQRGDEQREPGYYSAHNHDQLRDEQLPRHADQNKTPDADIFVSTNTANCREFNNSSLVLAFKELIQTMKTDGSSERYPVLNVIPEFDPSKRNQTIETWLTKVNECAEIYNWSERQIIHYALPKLTGLAQKWYQGLPSVLFSWNEWQNKLKLAFPSDQNYGQLLTDMLECKARFGECLEDYYYQKMVLLNRCGITGKHAIDCILFGIEDRSVRTSAEAVQFTEPDKLLVYLRNVRPAKKFEKPNLPLQSSNCNNVRQNKREKPCLNNLNTYINTKCFNCGENGHAYLKCNQPIKRCDKCQRVGHLSTNCVNKDELKNKTVLKISNEQDSDSKYFKEVVVNGKHLDSFIDLGSQCTMIKESVAKNLIDSWSTTNLPTLRGFGNNIVNCLGKFNADIKVDSARATVEVLVVPDHLLQVPILIGQSFTELKEIIVYKNNERLTIFMNPLNVHLYVRNSITVNDYTNVDIYTQPEYSGDLLIESIYCQNPFRQYEIFQSVVQVINGKGQIIVRGIKKSFELTKGSLLIRALPLSNTQMCNVHRVERCPGKSVVKQIETHMVHVDDNIGNDYINTLIKLLNDYRDCFAFSPKELGCITNTEMNITLNDTTPVVYRPYRLSYSERQVVRGMVEELEESGIVRESTSNYASPIVLVRKKSGDYRLCIDFRALNKKTKKEHYPLPRIDDQLDSLSGHRYYSTLDLASGYYQIPMAETSKHLTAFVTPDGHYEFNRMPFGLVNAPFTFQRAINNILGNSRFKRAFAYMDDIIIPSKTIEEGLRTLADILEIFRSSGLTLNLSKCHFLKHSIDYLGFEVNESGFKPGRKKIDAVEKFPRPIDQHGVRQFLGLASFFRRFLKGFSITAKPLTQLLKKDAKWQWTNAEETAFLNLKEDLVKRPILAFYNPKYETQLHTDACKVGLAGILMQRSNKDKPFNAVAYYSRQTSPEESKFTSYDLETLAVVVSLQRFRVYLLGIPFTIVTDCNSLRATFEKKDTLVRVARWWNIMQEFDFNIIYKPGTTMTHVDALSRNPTPSNVTELQVRQIDTDWISTVQHSDSELQRIICILNDKENENIIEIKKNFVVKKGLLYRKTEAGDRWVVPKGVRWQILKSNHDEIGHFGFDKTLEIIKSKYWFAKMRRFIKKYVESCLECAYSKIPSGKRAGLLHPIEKVEQPFHTLHIDHLGPFIRSKHKNSYLLTIIDAFTKFVILVPVKSTKSVHSVKAMKNYFHTFSVPKRIISDRGTSFTAKTFENYLNSLGIKHIKNAVATPRANGQVERYNRTILSALTTSNHGKPENVWDECVSEIQWGLNNTLNKGIGKSPAQALFGFNLIGTSNSTLQLSVTNETDNVVPTIEEIRKEITEHVRKDQEKQKKRFDKSRKTVTYEIGQLVRVEREIPSSGKSKKLVPKIRGPYRIAEVLDNDRYVIEDTPLSQKGNRKFSGIFSVDKIYPWVVFNRSDSESDSSTNDDN